MKILRVGAEMFHEDGRTHRRTEMTKLIVAFRNFAKAHKKSVWSHNRQIITKILGIKLNNMNNFVNIRVSYLTFQHA